jgi:acyl-CoA synthetase (NDP forming)
LNCPKDLSPIFQPRSIALVGVPRGFEPGKVFLQGLLDQGYPGKIFPVNPRADFIDGLRSYPSVKEIPEDIDLAILLVPAPLVLPALEQCGEKKVRAAVIYSSGFAETGDREGKKREEEILRVACNYGISLIGPNCMGVYAPNHRLAFFPGLPKEKGKVGMISQSGSLAILFSRMAGARGIYFSKIISSGNESDLNSSDFLSFLKDDPETEIIGAYLEGVKDGPAFLAALREAARKKPVILWKAGRTPKGARAAFSHTGSLAGSGMAWEAVKNQARILMVREAEEFLDVLTGFYYLPRKAGKRLAILSGPGGPAVAAADACEEFGLEVADLLEETRSRLKSVIPPTGTSARNPVDLGLASVFQVDLYWRAAEIVGRDPGVDILILQGRGATAELDSQYTNGIIEAHRKIGKPFIAISLGGMYLEDKSKEALLKAGIPIFPSAGRALRAYSYLARYGER